MRAAIPAGNLPGKPEWRDELEKDIRKFGKQVAEEYAKILVGVPYEDGSAKMARAMLINYGGGSKGPTGEPIRTKPGRFTWDDDMEGKSQSTARTEYLLPDAFNQQGCHYFEEALDLMKGIYLPYFQSALRNVNFARYVKSSARRR